MAESHTQPREENKIKPDGSYILHLIRITFPHEEIHLSGNQILHVDSRRPCLFISGRRASASSSLEVPQLGCLSESPHNTFKILLEDLRPESLRMGTGTFRFGNSASGLMPFGCNGCWVLEQ